MGMLSFIASLFPTPPVHDVTFDLTTTYPPRKPVAVRRVATTPQVPMEIVMNILEAAYDEDDVQSNLQLFASCSLVCRRWSFLAQKMLFRDVTLRSQHAYASFQQAVDRSTPHGGILGDAVARLRVVLDENQPYRLSQRSFARAVTYCPNLEELELSYFGRPDADPIGIPELARIQPARTAFDESALDILRGGPRIRRLHFSNWSDCPSALPQLLDVWPSLTSLSMAGAPPKLPSGAAVFPCALADVRMNFQSSPAVDFMKWLLHNSAGSLRALAFDRSPALELLDFLAAEHGATLAALALPACAPAEGAVLQQCVALRELRIESAWASPVVREAIPAGLRHLAVGVDMDTPLQSVLCSIRKSAGLARVTLQLWHGGEAHPLLGAVKVACAMRGVELRLTHDVRAFRAASFAV